MKPRSQLLTVVGVLFLLASAFPAVPPAYCEEGVKNLPLVFDPTTKKYFIGGNSKFLLKKGDQGGLIDRIEISVDGGEYHPYGEAIQFKEEGKHSLKFRAINPFSTWSPVQFVEVFVDLTAPTTEAKFPQSQSYKDETGVYLGLSSSVSLAAQDNLSGIASIEYSLDGKNFMPYTTPIPVGKPGKHSIYYRSSDRVGNMEAMKQLDFFADGTPPVTALKLQGSTKPTVVNGKTYISDGVALALEADDASSKVGQIWVSVDNKLTPYIKPIYFLEEGPHTIKYYSVDNVGNKEEERSVSIYSVSTPPKTVATTHGNIVNSGGINYSTSSFKLSLAAKDNVVGVERIEVRVDSEPDFRPYIEPISFKSSGIHTVSYHAIDRAGNVEPVKTYTIGIYDKAPETTISSAQPLVERDGVTYSPSPNVITFSAGNNLVGVKQILYSINDAPYTVYQGPITINSDRKLVKIAYKSVDKLGNEESPKIATFHMINSEPIVDLFISNGQARDEQVRTNFLEQAGAPAPQKPAQPARGLASEPAGK